MKIKNILVLCCVVLGSYSSISTAQETVKQLKTLPKASQLTAKTTDFSTTLTWQLPKEHSYSKALIYRNSYTLPIRRKNKAHGGVALGKLLAELDIKQQRFGDTQLEPQTRYYYRVILQDVNGDQSLPSLPAIASLKDTEIPDKVDTVKVEILDEMHFNLRWTASPSKDVQSYRVLRSRQNERPVMVKSVAINDESQSIYSSKITQRKNIGLTYLYAVAAVDAAGNVSKLSPYVSVRLADNQAPRSPLLLRAIQKQDSIHLSWKANLEDDLSGYHIYRKNNKVEDSFVKLNESEVQENAFIDRSIQGLSDYRYYVAAVDVFANESAETKGYPIRTKLIQRAIDIPKGVKLSVSEQGFPKISWQLTASENQTLKSSVFRSDGEKYTMISPMLSDNYFVDNSIQQGKAYHYMIKTVTQVGQFSGKSKSVLWTGAEK